MADLVLAVDVGGTKMAAGLVDAQSAVVARGQVPTRVAEAGDDGEVLWADLAHLLDGMLDAVPAGDRVVTCGAGCGGPMSPGGEEVSPLNIGPWRSFPLRSRLAAHTGVPAFVDNDQAQRIMGLMLRHLVGIQRTLAESPTRFRPLLYVSEEREADDNARAPLEATAWCEGYMAGVRLRDDAWQPLYDAQDARDWIFPIEALAFGDQDPEFADWVDDKDRRESLVDELPVATVLIYRFWFERRRGGEARRGGARREPAESARKSRQRLH